MNTAEIIGILNQTVEYLEKVKGSKKSTEFVLNIMHETIDQMYIDDEDNNEHPDS